MANDLRGFHLVLRLWGRITCHHEPLYLPQFQPDWLDENRLSPSFGKSIKALPMRSSALRALQLDVVVQCELERMWPKSDSVRLILALIADEGFDQFLGENVTL